MLCSVSDPSVALSEMRRMLRPGSGRLLFIEHVAAPNPGAIRTLQGLLDPLQQLLADGEIIRLKTIRGVRQFSVLFRHLLPAAVQLL